MKNYKKTLVIGILPILGLMVSNTALAKETSSFLHNTETYQKQGGLFKKQFGEKKIQNNPNVHLYLQQVLGMSSDEIQKAFSEGKTIDELLAQKGLSKSSLKQDFMKAHQEDIKNKLSERVASGKITQAQADEILKQKEEMKDTHISKLAQILGTTPEKIRTDQAAGKTLEETIASLGLDKKEMMEKIKENHKIFVKEKLTEDVASGKITQAQADEILKQKEETRNLKNEALLKALDMTDAELQTALTQGKSINDIITEKGLSKEEVRSIIRAELPKENTQKNSLFNKVKNTIKNFFHK